MQTNLYLVVYNPLMNNIEVLKEFGKLIRRYRLSKCLSQEELAFQCNIHRNQIGMIERGFAEPKLSTILILFKVLKIPGTDLNFYIDNIIIKNYD